MRRPIYVLGFTLLAGTAVSFLLSSSLALQLALALALTGSISLLLKRKYSFITTLLAFGLALGFLLGAHYTIKHLEPFLSPPTTPVIVTGLVTQSRTTGAGQRYRIKGEFPYSPLPPTTLIVRDYEGAELGEGDLVELAVQLKAPKYKATADYYKTQGIPIEGSLIKVHSRSPTKGNVTQKLERALLTYRRFIKEKNKANLPPDTAALVNGMVFGMTEDLSGQLYSGLNRAGTSHLLSVSGFHLSVLTGVLLLFLKKLGLAPLPSSLIGMGAAVAFTLLVGLSPPILRSCVMTCVFLLGKGISRDSDSLTSMGISAALIPILWPYWVFSAGLWLSFAATLGIVVLSAPINRWLQARFAPKDSLRKGMLASLSVTLGAYLPIFPLLVFLSGQVPLISPLANLLVGPFSTLFLVLGALLPFLPAGNILYRFTAIILTISGRLIEGISLKLGGLPLASFSIDSLLLFVLVLLVIGLLTFSLWRLYHKKRHFMLPILLSSAILLSLGRGVTTLAQVSVLQLIKIEQVASPLWIRGSAAVLVGLPTKYEVAPLVDYLHYRSIKSIDLIVDPYTKGGLHSGYTRLRDEFPINAVVGPSDSFILSQLAHYFPGTPVYSSQEASINFLGGVSGRFPLGSKDFHFQVGDVTVTHTREKYDIINTPSVEHPVFYPDGIGVLPVHYTFTKNPIGQWVYGERRLDFTL